MVERAGRVAQDILRRSLIDYWQEGRCAVSGLDALPLLRAPHIKPRAQCESDAEPLDVFNGLLLAPHVDALFDGGWISFDDDGGVLVSPELLGEQRVLLGVQPGLAACGVGRATHRLPGLASAVLPSMNEASARSHRSCGRQAPKPLCVLDRNQTRELGKYRTRRPVRAVGDALHNAR